jgi:protein-S-isoprenylcysteine O-methyltransferase Ste14
LNLLAVVLGRPTPANLLVFGAILASCVWRISLEERCLAGYHDYARRVPWRLLPGVY